MKKLCLIRCLSPIALSLLLTSPTSAKGNASQGSEIFESQCAECHSIKPGKHRKGPSLFDSIGRKAGTQPNYNYSDAMQQSGLVWTEDKLKSFLSAPKLVLPGNKMKFSEPLTAEEMNDLVAFLSTLH